MVLLHCYGGNPMPCHGEKFVEVWPCCDLPMSDSDIEWLNLSAKIQKMAVPPMNMLSAIEKHIDGCSAYVDCRLSDNGDLIVERHKEK